MGMGLYQNFDPNFDPKESDITLVHLNAQTSMRKPVMRKPVID
jgi:hypothetical protein